MPPGPFFVRMPRKPRYTKGTSVEPPRQQPPVAPLPSNNGSVSTAAPLRPFQPSRSKPRPEPQTASDSDGIVKQAKMSVRKAMERSLNGKKIVLRFNEDPQAVGDGASLWTLSLQEMFHFQEDSGGNQGNIFATNRELLEGYKGEAACLTLQTSKDT
ncbi:hypothetical protein AHAS_Ahas09G0165600 [Arachis hypogaea]